jgi:transcriptional regulator with XRE-family HTH domain
MSTKTIGDQLRAARLRKNWTPEAAAKATKIRVSQIENLEKGELTQFANAAYARGFVRIYARALEMDDQKVLSQLDGTLEEDAEPVKRLPAVEYVPEAVQMSGSARVNEVGRQIVYALVGVMVLIVGSFVYNAWRANKIGSEGGAPLVAAPLPGVPEAPAVQTPGIARALPAQPLSPEELAAQAEETAPAAVPVMSATPAPVLPGGIRKMSLQAMRTSWVTVTKIDQDPRLVYEGQIEAGQSKDFEGGRFEVRIAIPSAVNVILDGANTGPWSNDVSPRTFIIPPSPAQ